jgi:sulfur-carrier protein adenylyltransferase/sulfurtransferase
MPRNLQFDMDSASFPLSAAEIERYTTQINLCEIGLSGQKKLKSASVGVIGAGGLGCSALLHLAAAGIGNIGIIDGDVIEISNLQRQILYHLGDIGKPKCEVAKERLLLINPHVDFHSTQLFFSSENSKDILHKYELIIDATDNFSARYAINDACLKSAKPFVYGSIDHFEGQIAVFNALGSNGKRGPNYRSLYPVPPPPNFIPSCAEGGVIGALPGIIGSIQALEAIKLILGIGQTLSGKLLKINALTWASRLYQICPEDPHTEQPLEITSETLHQMLLDNINLQLIDIRENSENSLKNPRAISLPFSQLMDRYTQLPKDKVTILCCRKGFRSIQATKILRNCSYFKEVYSLKGGIAAIE